MIAFCYATALFGSVRFDLNQSLSFNFVELLEKCQLFEIVKPSFFAQ